jgi:hypothetical protein
MPDQSDPLKSRSLSIEADQYSIPSNRLKRGVAGKALVLLVIFALGGGYMMGRHLMAAPTVSSEPSRYYDARSKLTLRTGIKLQPCSVT